MRIYAARNIVNGKLYIGLTTISVAARWQQHCYQAAAKTKHHALHRAIKKCGAGAFVVEEIASLAPGLSYADLCQLERELIAQEGCKVPHGYNMTDGGEGTIGRQTPVESYKSAWTPERRAKAATKMSELRRDGVCVPAAEIDGAGLTDDQKRQRSETMKLVMAAASPARKAKHADHCRRVSAARIGKKAAAETRAKMSAAHSSPELRERHAATAKRTVESGAHAAANAQRAATMKAFWAAKKSQTEAVH